MDPPQGGELDFSDRRPQALSMHQFRFVETIDCFGQSVVITITGCSYTWPNSGFSPPGRFNVNEREQQISASAVVRYLKNWSIC